jgi:hypothetical protein
MSCQPPYDYRPIVAPVADCHAPVYPEHRSRLFAGGTYFRSLEQNPSQNNISLQIADNIDGNPDKFRLTVRYYEVLGQSVTATETYDVIQVPGLGDGEYTCDINAILLLRTAVNGASQYIEMYPRGTDLGFDYRGEDVIVSDNGCLTTILETFMSGGTGGPTGPEQIAKIDTGPQRTIIVISTSEKENGESANPLPHKKIMQWNGNEWITYSNNITGQCPL